jgi:hypothetical protein
LTPKPGNLGELAVKKTIPHIKQRLMLWRDKPLNIVAEDWIHELDFCPAVITHNIKFEGKNVYRIRVKASGRYLHARRSVVDR